MKAQRQIPEGARAIKHKLSPAVVYVWEAVNTKGKIFYGVRAFEGARVKFEFSEWYGNEAARARRIEIYFERCACEAREAKERAEKGALMFAALRAGDFLVSQWGYEQTNVYYYQILKKFGTQSLQLRRVQERREYKGYMDGRAYPILNAFIEREDAFVARFVNGYVTINSYAIARPYEGNGADFSSYA